MKNTVLSLFLASFVISAHANIQVGNGGSQKVTVENGAIVNSAVGAVSKAKLNAASNEGNVKIGNKHNMTVSVKNGAMINSAVGAGTTATLNAASNTSK